MIRRTAVVAKAESVASTTPDVATSRPGFISLLLVSAWCGLVAGLLEVSTIVLSKLVFDPNQFFRMSRHFVWLIPVSNLCVFLPLGLVGCGVILVWPRHGRWLLTRVLCAFVLLPSLLVAFPRIYSLACLVLALGLATPLIPLIERRGPHFRRLVVVSLPAVIAVVALLGASLWEGDRIKQVRENARPLPPPGSPNVLLIVLDSVAAGHLSLHGYDRATSPTLVELAERGARFESARAASSWTLPSHATMFTGRWLHELSVGWVTPLDRTFPTLAEFLGDRGYATAGFVANLGYCAADSGLSRGFTRYQDFIFPKLTALKTAVMVNRALEGRGVIGYYSEDWLDSTGLMPYAKRLVQSLDVDRKGAAVVNRELLDWLSHREQPERPFFAFLNYNDAHYPYELPPGRPHRFGAEATEKDQDLLIRQWGELDKTVVSLAGVAFAADAYDDCMADLDEQLGNLVDLLDQRGILEQTWLIITSDHGESFGEHPGVFCHGGSLYDTEVHVPLIIVPPAGSAPLHAVKEAVSLRDLAATIVDLTGLEVGAPFPGVSLARLWKEPRPLEPVQHALVSPALAEVVPDPRKREQVGLPMQLSPQVALKDSEWSYIRREADAGEKLFHLREDANEQRDLVSDPAAQMSLERMRSALDRLTGGPL